MKTLFKTTFLLTLLLLVNSCKQTEKKEAENGAKRQDNIQGAKDSEAVAIKVGKGPDAMFLTPDKQKIYIANVEDTNISVLSTQTDQVEKIISGVRNPWGFSRLGNTNEVAVSAYDKQIVVIDFTKDEIVRQKDFDSPLGGIVTSKDGKAIFVIAIDAKKVWKLNAQTFKIMDTYDTGNSPDGIGLSADESNIYVTNTEDGTISIINAQTKKIKLLNTGGKPELVHSNHDRGLLFISNFLENKMHVIDSNKGEIIHELTGFDGTEEGVLSQNEDKLYVVNFNISKVFVYKMEGFEKLEKEYSTGNQPIGIIPLVNKLYVTNYGDNSVSVINLK
jgi:YVTN family beta-propeller protein